MSKYDRMILNFEIAILIFGLINLAWAVAKAAFIGWAVFPFSRTNLNVYVALLVGLFLTQFALRDFIHYARHKKIKHGFDERTTRILSNSLRNAAVIAVLIIYAAVLYYELFYETTIPLFSIRQISYVISVGVIVFFASYFYYQKKKNL